MNPVKGQAQETGPTDIKGKETRAGLIVNP